jgi:flagellar protein FlbD
VPGIYCPVPTKICKRGYTMITLTTIKGNSFYLNSDLIEQIEELPDTLITLVNGKTVRVSESAESVVEKIVDYKRRIYYRGIDLELKK